MEHLLELPELPTPKKNLNLSLIELTGKDMVIFEYLLDGVEFLFLCKGFEQKLGQSHHSRSLFCTPPRLPLGSS